MPDSVEYLQDVEESSGRVVNEVEIVRNVFCDPPWFHRRYAESLQEDGGLEHLQSLGQGLFTRSLIGQ